jgi:hypothetical protein
MSGLARRDADVSAVEVLSRPSAAAGLHELVGAMGAYGIGVVPRGSARHTMAADHLRHCAGCRRYVLLVRGLGVLPPPLTIEVKALGVIGDLLGLV